MELDSQKEKINLDKFKKICKEEVPQKLIQFAKKFINDDPITIQKKDLFKMANFISQSKEDFIKTTLFLDCFSRKSKFFKVISQVYIWAITNNEKASMFYNPCGLCIVKSICQKYCDEKLCKAMLSNKYIKYKDITKDELIFT